MQILSYHGCVSSPPTECGIPLASSIGLAPHGINPGPKDKEGMCEVTDKH